jgi:hypothetical protein
MGLPNWRRSWVYFAVWPQGFDGDLVAFADFSEDVGGGHPAVVEEELAGGGGADAELVFLLADGEAGGFTLDEEGRDALIAGRGINRSEDDEEASFGGVGDPELAAVDHVIVTVETRVGG